MTNIKRSLFALSALAMLAGTVSAAEKKAAPKAPAATTLENLQAAFNGESNARAKYEAYAAKAEEEGYLGAASLFKAASLAESIHAANHGKVITAMGAVPKAEVKLPEIKTTAENLKDAVKGENYEAKTMYPAFLKKARADNNSKAVSTFTFAMAVEKMHAKYYAEALANLKDWKAKKKFIVCQNCGATTTDMALKRCPVCAFPRAQFTEVE